MRRELLINQGVPEYGIFPEGVQTVNAADFQPYSPMGRARGRLARRFGWNQFHFVGLFAQDLVLGCAIVDLKWVGNAFVYVYQPSLKRLSEWSWLQPLARQTVIPNEPNLGRSFARKGQRSLEILAEAESRRVVAHLGKDVSFDFVLRQEEAFRPLCLCSRAGYTGWVYTQKAAGLKVEGQLALGNDRFDLGTLGAYGGYDWTSGFMRRETFWNWASISARLKDGRVLGLNLAAGVNETGFTENGFWLDQEFHKVDTVDFQFDRRDLYRNWRIRSNDGRVDLIFEPEGVRQEKLNVLLLASNFKQMFGSFRGTLQTGSGETVHVDGVPGFAEDHYARW